MELKRIADKRNVILLLSVVFINMVVFGYKMIPDIRKIYENSHSEQNDKTWEQMRIIKQKKYADEYNGNIQKIIERAQILESNKLFADKDSFSYNNIVKTAKDYKPLLNVRITLDDNTAVEKISEDKVRLYNLAFYDNYVYIYSSSGNCTHTFDGSMQISIRKRSLDGKEDTKIITSDEENSIFDALKVYGGNLFFVYTHTAFNKETRKNETTSEGLFCYNSYTGKVGKIIDKRISDCTVDEENRVLYYYVINEGLYKYEFDTGVDKLIYKANRNTALCQVSYDGKYIYLDNGRWYIFTRDNDLSAKIWVLDSDGKELNVIDNAGISPSYFGDSESLFSEYGALLGNRVDLDEKDTGVRYILKSDITTAKNWKKVMWR